MKQIHLLLSILFLIVSTHFAYNIQAQEIPKLDNYVDSNYVDYVSSITITSQNGGAQYLNRRLYRMDEIVRVTFDILGDNDYYYHYTIVHCDKNWSPTDLPRSELVGGYDYVRLDDRSYSGSTYTDYTHYDFPIFQKDMQWKASGNYMLIVFLRDPTEVVFTRKFILSENLLKSSMEGRRTSTGASINSHHLLEFTTEIPPEAHIDNPQANLHLVMFQNLEQDGIGPVEPRSKVGNSIRWNYPDLFAFPANKEWRLSDIRSLRNLRYGVDRIYDNRDTIFAEKLIDYDRVNKSRDSYQDINGGFVLQNMDLGEYGDYALVRYRLKSDLPRFRDVYLVGAFTQFRCLPEYKLKYDAENDLYYVDIFQKQGAYDYMYAAMDEQTGLPDYAYVEGNDIETFNKYYGVVYYRSFTDRYDRVIGYSCYKYQCEFPLATKCVCE